MSIFDDHNSIDSIRKFVDAEILKQYKVSNSGATLLPRWTREKPALHEKSSVFKRIFGGSPEMVEKYWGKFNETINRIGLSSLSYNGKDYYETNRDIRNKIKYEVLK